MDVEQAKASSRPLEDYEIWERSPRGRADGIPDQPKIHRTMMTLPGDGDRIIEPNAVQDYKRILESSVLDVAHFMEKITEVLDPELLEIAYGEVETENFKNRQGDLATNEGMGLRILEQELLQILKEETIHAVVAQDTKSRNRRKVTTEWRVREMKRFWRKMTAAVLSGLALIVPMLIMVLHPTLVTVTVTTSVFVLFVSVPVVVVMKDAEPKDVVAAMAAYAAVLVVFVGVAGSERDSPDDSSTMSKGIIGAIVAGSIVGTLLLIIAVFLV